MNSLSQKLYAASPVFIQNLATSVYGYHLHRQRYGKDSGRFLSQLLASQWHSREVLRRLQDERLAALVRHACATTGHYRTVYRSQGIDPETIRSVDDLPRLPPLERDTMRRAGTTLRASEHPPSTFVLHTSGTTGSPSAVYCDRVSRIRHYSFLSRLRRWFDIDVGMRRATLGGRIIVPHSQAKPPFWRYDWSENNYVFSSYHLADRHLDSYCEQVAKIQPVEITGYASSVYALARHWLKGGYQTVPPRAVITTAETLLDHQRETIQKAFGAPVADQYGCTEMALFISQCERGTYHVHPEYGFVEVVDTENRPLPPGQEGDVLCTAFVNPTMPLIRYRIGDRLSLGEGPCPCGRHFPVVERILGRKDDLIITPDGRAVGRLDPIFKDLTGIAEAQIIQVDQHHLTLKIVRDPSFTDRDRHELIHETRKRVGDDMAIDVQFVENIPRDKSGKFPAVVSHLARPRSGQGP